MKDEILEEWKDTWNWGWIILIGTWSIGIIGIWSSLGLSRLVITHCYNVTDEKCYQLYQKISTWSSKTFDGTEVEIGDYYIMMLLLLGVMAWVWCITSWVGMKLFRHATGEGKERERKGVID
ncbi:hypothetical protein CANCADRAFT_1517 [Tortispora caseinolytica NRRL Y-17796]|uniref:Uncharacterized protein n=1 Tax=Tortispora caseinolytica NRRL Y-17796 TaxID=767744 RepID=A0A1E4TMD3_9ASCO|nr:hypothetical protein CANCADRAFT_1517 [Tortispora caseinolytica NRRL Y-17796]